MTETTNFGLKKPEETDFYDVNTQNDNMDAIDSVLQEFKDGTQPVGDSAKLGGKVASEYALHIDGVLTGSESILDKAKTLSYGVWQFRFDSHDGTDLPHVGYKYGVATVFVRAGTGISVYLWGSTSAKSIAVNHWNGTSWSGWDRDAKTSDLANYLPLSGGTIGYLYVKGANNGAFHILKNHTDSVDNGTLLSDINKNNEKTSINISANNDAAYLRKKDNSIKELLHTGNKPTGTYTGNGDATQRDIATGGIGRACLIWASDTSGGAASTLLMQTGGFGQRSGQSIIFAQGVARYESGGTIRLLTADASLNEVGKTYTWIVI